jgi:dihydroorotase
MTRLTALANAANIEGVLLIDGDRIGGIAASAPAGAIAHDCRGGYVAPGIVDLGVFKVDRAACIAGGITRVALMPDQRPALDDPGLVQRAALAAKPDLWVHPIAAATRGLEGKDLAEYALMARAGAKAVATGRVWIANSGVMVKAMAYAGSLGLSFISHPEDGGLSGGAIATAGETATRLGLASAPAAAEALAIARDVALVRETGTRLHFRQVTTAAGLGLVRSAKAEGLPVSCGITPAHLFLSDIAVTDFRTYSRLSPPLRSEDDRRACLSAVADGTIDILCSAHDPQGPEAKRLPFADAMPGMSGAETLLALGLGLVRDGLIDTDRLHDMLSGAPSRLLGIGSGSLEVGAPADIMIYDPETPWIIDGPNFVASAGNTPFHRLPVQGRVTATIKGGRLLTA